MTVEPAYEGENVSYLELLPVNVTCPGFSTCGLKPAAGSDFEVVLGGENIADADHTLESVVVNSPFSVAYSETPYDVPGESIFVIIVLVQAPSTAGSYALSLSIETV